MYKPSFGTRNQVQFKNEHEYYELLGFLAKSDGTTSLAWEHNEDQGAWGSEGRIHFFTSNYPFAATLTHTAGVGRIFSRVNCNEFVQNLHDDHQFINGTAQNIEVIRTTIPKEFLVDFERGVNLDIDIIDDEDTSSGESIVTPFKPEDIKITNPPMNLGDLIDMIREGWINFDTEYQREGNLWKGNKPSRLIESILLGLRLPAFYFEEISKKEWNIIDGLQRCWVIKNFCVDETFALNDLEFLSRFDGSKFKYSDFNFEIKRDIRMLPITVNVVDKGSPDDVKYILFKRLNSGGMELTNQEVRNAVYNGVAINTIKSMLPKFQWLVENRISNERKEAEDFIARYAAFYVTPYASYEPDLDKFINKALGIIRDVYTQGQREKMVRDFDKAMEVANAIFGNDAFRKRYDPNAMRGRINKAYFEVIANVFARLSDKDAEMLILQKETLKHNLIKIMHNDGFNRSLSSATGNKEAVNKRFSWFEIVVRHSIDGKTINVGEYGNKIEVE
jgi:hypothetical protein